MILLEFHNRVVEEVLKLAIEKPQPLEVCCSDFDGVAFRISTPADKNSNHLVTVSISWPAIQELLRLGGQAQLDSLYGAYLTHAEDKHDVSLVLDLNQLASNPADLQKIPRHISLLKRHLLAGPFLQAFAQAKAGGGNMVQIHYRQDESIFIKPASETVTVVFSIFLGSPPPADDPNPQEIRLFFKVFLQEFAAVRRTVKNAPAVTFNDREPPQELAAIREVQGRNDLGFVSFVLFQSHIEDRNAHTTIDMIQTFRDYLHYHIKCSKAYMHERMRARVVALLQILNRAKPEPVVAKSKKVWGGKTFAGAGTSKSLGGAAAMTRGRGAPPARGSPAPRGYPAPRGFAR